MPVAKLKRSQSSRAYMASAAKRRKLTIAQRRGMAVPGYTRSVGNYRRFGPGGELKFHDVDIDDAVISAAGTILNGGTINVIQQGVTESQRVGRKCTIRNLHWRYNVRLTEQAADTSPPASDVVRVILYVDRQANGAAATTTDILEEDNWQSFRNLANSGRFSIMYDKTHTLNQTAMTINGADNFNTNEVFREAQFHKTCMVPIEYSGTTGALGEIRSNNFGVLLLSINGVCSFDSKLRMRFSDN